MRAQRAAYLVLWLLSFLPVTSRGAVLTFAFEGEVAQVADSVGVLSFIHPGQRFSYTFSFDTDAPNVYPYPDLSAGSYAGISSSLMVGGFPFPTGVPVINTSDHLDDFFSVGSNIEWDRPELLPGGHGVSVELWGGDAMQSPALPQAPYELNLWTYEDFQISFIAPGGSTGVLLSIVGSIDSMRLVPEPASALLLGFAGFLVACKCSRS